MGLLKKVLPTINAYNDCLNKFQLAPSPIPPSPSVGAGICDYCHTKSTNVSNTFVFDIDNFCEKYHKKACEDCLEVLNIDNCLNATYQSLCGNTQSLERIFDKFASINQLETSKAGQVLNELISIAYSMQLLIKDDPLKLKQSF